jgi:hypothetical protein
MRTFAFYLDAYLFCKQNGVNPMAIKKTGFREWSLDPVAMIAADDGVLYDEYPVEAAKVEPKKVDHFRLYKGIDDAQMVELQRRVTNDIETDALNRSMHHG